MKNLTFFRVGGGGPLIIHFYSNCTFSNLKKKIVFTIETGVHNILG